MAASTSGTSWGALLLAAFLLLLVSPADGRRHLIRRGLQRRQHQHQQHHFQQNVTLGLNPGSYHESGPWGPWTTNSSCSRTCGGGVAYQTRVCEDFRADGTHGCVGPSKRYFSCNVEECPDYTKDFREEQCARFNSIAFEGRYYSWVPYYKAANPCELNCRPIGERFYYRHSPKTIDGTRCHDDGSLDVCVNGACMPVGCDKMLGSDAVEDKCGKCRGVGTSCSTIEGVFDTDNLEVGESTQSLYPLRSKRETEQILMKSGNVSRGSNVCVLPEQKGNCTEYFERWYYNVEEGRCRQFYYSGCGGNANNFASSRDCEQMCGQPAPTDIADEEFTLAFCFMESEAGPCRNMELRWFYDIKDGVCREFYYGGCKGNPNRFRSHQECEEKCYHAQDPCDLPQVPGNCREMIPQWFYNPVTYRCQEFNYSGCQGNANRFNDRESCELRCPPLPTEQPVEHVTPLDGYTTAKGEVSGGRAEGSCEATKFGCCQDKIRAAKGPDFEGCGNCSDSLFGCCEDNTTFALGPSGEGCRVVTQFGCCRDNVTAASADGCMCNGTMHGCCPGNVPIALGPDFEGCTCDHCAFGCCPDKKTAADGPEFEGCFNCTNTTFGCCPDEVTAAQGPNFEGCEGFETNCTNTTFGCCPDGLSAAEGENFAGCVVACESTAFGCCPDGLTPASGIGFEGCDNCSESLYGCCADNTSFVLGPGGEGCCFHTEFGCCQDNKTEAQGPDFAGCSCHTTPHGCCPDGVSTARGPRYYGCTCHNYPLGCCQDDHTPAEGPNFEGCLCSRLLYGCCPDDVTPARGPNLHGCPCQTTPFGCCLDNRTHAQGPNLAGCGCETMPYGCCPDQRTPARGPAFGGCPCTALPYGCCPDQQTAAQGPDGMGCECKKLAFGCCPDGRTAATGPSLTGCTCHHYPHGCCPDGRTPARGPDADGCTCALTAYGCCPDGVTAARGRNFEGCPLDPRITVPARNVSASVCGLPEDLGPCRNYSVNWFFSVADGRCTRFWYGGCEGNGNRFNSQEECEDTCVNPRGPDACLLPKVVGSCDGQYEHWYFDATTRSCASFMYGGCLGNSNRFTSKDLCEQTCLHQETLDPCELSVSPGPCRGSFPRFYYDRQDNRCKQFTFGGCQGNSNNFATEEECSERCVRLSAHEICILSKEEGQCLSTVRKWYYDYLEERCKEFVYTGCQGNRNRFDTRQQCERMCNSTRVAVSRDVCAQPKQEGPCGGAIVHWYYNMAAGRCEQFYYGGCQGNANRFENRRDCQRACISAGGRNVCMLPQEAGKCVDFRERWYYNAEEGRCYRFYYGGCDGNANNFGSHLECEQVCRQPAPTDVAEEEFRLEFCFMASEAGPCWNHEVRWFYDKEDGACREFYYGGCQGNRNRFRTHRECVEKCYRAQDLCTLPKVPGSCSGQFVQWFYDPETDQCHAFAYSGCQGNANRFNDRESCEGRCRKGAPLPNEQPVDRATAPGRNVCMLPQEAGNCVDFRARWYYNAEEGRCHRFYYGGCEGNANNFGSHLECEQVCRQPAPTDVAEEEFPLEFCFMASEAGPCRNMEVRWFYDKEDGVCREFYYGGCQGNRNRFRTHRECEEKCYRAQDLCTLPKVPGSCSGQFVHWFYDPETDRCHEFAYSGCQGNANRFNDRESCEVRCRKGAPLPTEQPVDRVTPLDACAQPKQPGPCYGVLPMWYYDSYARECRNFTYGGCEGNDNRFESRELCEQRCTNFVPPVPPTPRTNKPGHIRKAVVCKMMVAPGRCQKMYARWFYEVKTGRCLPFVYTGCEGNKNRFRTKEICMSFCHGVTMDSPDSELDEDKARMVPGAPPTRTEPPISGEELDPRIKPAISVTPVPKEVQATKPLPRPTAAPECLPSNCEELQCPLGKNQTVDHLGCVQCRCSNPCETFSCREEELCRIEAYRSADGRPNYRPICRLEISAALTSTATRAPISTAEPTTEAPTTPHHQPPQSQHPHRNGSGHLGAVQANPDVTANAGSDVTLPCLDRPFSIVHLSWTFRDEPVESNEGRFKILVNHSLHISHLSGDDTGPYRCTADDGHNTVSQVTNLVVYVPATIRPSDDLVSVRVSETARLACVAVGFPRPFVQWYRGGKQLPQSSARYATRADFTLVIRNVTQEDEGIYMCRAYNYHGDPAVWKVSLSVLPPYPSPSRSAWRRRRRGHHSLRDTSEGLWRRGRKVYQSVRKVPQKGRGRKGGRLKFGKRG